MEKSKFIALKSSTGDMLYIKASTISAIFTLDGDNVVVADGIRYYVEIPTKDLISALQEYFIFPQ